jgi:hypothetical protein
MSHSVNTVLRDSEWCYRYVDVGTCFGRWQCGNYNSKRYKLRTIETDVKVRPTLNNVHEQDDVVKVG